VIRLCPRPPFAVRLQGLWFRCRPRHWSGDWTPRSPRWPRSPGLSLRPSSPFLVQRRQLHHNIGEARNGLRALLLGAPGGAPSPAPAPRGDGPAFKRDTEASDSEVFLGREAVLRDDGRSELVMVSAVELLPCSISLDPRTPLRSSLCLDLCTTENQPPTRLRMLPAAPMQSSNELPTCLRTHPAALVQSSNELPKKPLDAFWAHLKMHSSTPQDASGRTGALAQTESRTIQALYWGRKSLDTCNNRACELSFENHEASTRGCRRSMAGARTIGRGSIGTVAVQNVVMVCWGKLH